MARAGTGNTIRVLRKDESRDAAAEFERLYRDAYPLVYNYTYRALANRPSAEDVTSEAFLKAAQSFGRFDSSRAKFSTWVVAIARNCIADYWHKNKQDAPLENVSEAVCAVDDDHAEQACDADLVQRLLETLSLDERELVFMKYYEGKRNSEIAEELDMNASTVSTKLARALARMRVVAERSA